MALTLTNQDVSVGSAIGYVGREAARNDPRKSEYKIFENNQQQMQKITSL